MSDQPPRDEAFAADLAVIGRLAEELRLSWWPGEPDTIFEIGDLENSSILAFRHGAFTFDTTSRGQHADDAQLIVVGAHGKGLVRRVRRVLLGSVSRQVLNDADRPVAVVDLPDN
jgi:nucleotide-binding universal stress UspA family protein